MKKLNSNKVKKTKPNYETKSYILKLTLYGEPLIKILTKINYSLNCPNSKTAWSDKVINEYLEIIENQFTSEILTECQKLIKSQNNRQFRVKQRVEEITLKPCLFLTMTFTDIVLNSTTDIQRRRKIKKFLGQFKVPYIANIDFGESESYIDDDGELHKGTHREHYHGIIQLERINPKLYKYGNLDIKPVRLGKEQSAISKYISKLTNHAIKESTKRSVILYSRTEWGDLKK